LAAPEDSRADHQEAKSCKMGRKGSTIGRERKREWQKKTNGELDQVPDLGEGRRDDSRLDDNVGSDGGGHVLRKEEEGGDEKGETRRRRRGEGASG
jgi:hypothetical protein